MQRALTRRIAGGREDEASAAAFFTLVVEKKVCLEILKFSFFA
jgi:hypothetical protein